MGLSFPQGAGKTTLCTVLEKTLLSVYGIKTVILSIDDFYHPHQKQKDICLQSNGNFYLSGRGVAGTHDLELCLSTIARFLAWHAHIHCYVL